MNGWQESVVSGGLNIRTLHLVMRVLSARIWIGTCQLQIHCVRKGCLSIVFKCEEAPERVAFLYHFCGWASVRRRECQKP